MPKLSVKNKAKAAKAKVKAAKAELKAEKLAAAKNNPPRTRTGHGEMFFKLQGKNICLLYLSLSFLREVSFLRASARERLPAARPLG